MCIPALAHWQLHQKLVQMTESGSRAQRLALALALAGPQSLHC